MTNIPVKTSSDRRQAGDDELKADLIISMRSLRAHFTHHNIMAMANSTQKGTPTAKRFKN